jgi:hypothetical protein
MNWTLDEAIPVIIKIEQIAPKVGCHVALTGSILYGNGGPKKDLDLLFYRIRQWDKIDMAGLFSGLETLGMQHISGFGWCHKAKYKERPIDMFFPEEETGEYVSLADLEQPPVPESPAP